MQQTEKYKFNIIETSDSFGPDALNANARTAEAQLAALAAADTANRTALEQALAAQKSTHAADKAALDAAVNALKADVHPGAPGQIARIAQGTYVGTGTIYSWEPCRLDFDFKPLLVFVCSAAEKYTHIMMRPSTISNNGTNSGATVTWGEKSVTWSFTSVQTQCNFKGITYTYFAIGAPV